MANASYAARQPPAVESEKPVHVLVTGFGPFLNRYPKNSSWEIASTLPALIPASPGNPTPIHIHIHHEPIRVAYKNVVDTIPKLLCMTPQPDLVLHIGLAASRKFYAIEQGAHSRGYGKTSDVDGELFPDSEAQKAFPDSKYPSALHTGFDTGDVLSRWRTSLGYNNPNGTASIERLPELRTNSDAGNFLCGFIYYNSLAHFHSRDPEAEKPVVFMHVPDLSGSEAKLREGWEVAVALIKALVESRRKVGVGSGGERGECAGQDDDARNNTAV
ncbi:peptidase C15, pyroglutamyl peptidase I-like protein [Didymella exigua CBS 183.55]|uniref:Peptidase C15, pyroglutamyl peptidase I-like protein n=1 Tax=Didymella exigua CBS 183.55 TaxID=1150837 RepID=A0A6A5R8I7_9PLEO|nr:peptidase C15, pyroglutamyl peptidase I-like protein [Didymella exigua CBS 183.55]KAF1923629.1 peptidase C15, pyroglutamyl peptidase I-like protein [Didymella exigua CBS 183.55]